MSNFSNIYETQLHKAIDLYGRNISIIWGSTTECNSCDYDPINKEATNVSCDTCGGLYYYPTEHTLRRKGVMKTFVGNMKYIDYSLNKFGYNPDFDARLTCWLEDVLIKADSATGNSYLDEDKNIRVETDGKKYDIQGTFRTGVEDLKIIIATLKEIKSE